MLESTIMKAKYLALDCEMGGIGLQYSLLTACFDLLDKDLNKVDRLYLQVKPDDGEYVLSARGMEVNGIDIVEHDKVAIPYKDAKSVLYAFLNQEGARTIENKLIVIGHQAHGDVAQICDKVISNNSWNNFCAYRVIDTAGIAQFLILAGLLILSEENQGASLAALARHYGVKEQPKVGHNAGDDVDITVGVLMGMLRDVKLLKDIKIMTGSPAGFQNCDICGEQSSNSGIIEKYRYICPKCQKTASHHV